ncbi:hypothetical protein ABID21_004283 [Pseudorhizobium tarimense]|uniref:Alcohol dehydrogenase-like N-terminal domain-containing protein n=1 Tax=Pseudorhizobium tarimense TaxID=1079109 RepID=A0ABV2HC75_9HYPH
MSRSLRRSRSPPWRGDDQHSDGTYRVAADSPSGQRDNDRDQPKIDGVTIRQPRHRRLLVARLLDETHDAGIGRRVGIPRLGHTCGHCPYCTNGEQNLCDTPQFTGYTRDGGFATHVVADQDYAFDPPEDADPVALARSSAPGLSDGGR